MKTIISALFAFVTVSLAFNGHTAEVIANSATKITPNDLRDIYVGEMTAVAGVRLMPLDNSAAQAKFTQVVLKLETRKYQAIWIKKAFRDGLTEPAMKSSDAEVIDIIKKTPGAVGYIEGTAPAGVVSILKY